MFNRDLYFSLSSRIHKPHSKLDNKKALVITSKERCFYMELEFTTLTQLGKIIHRVNNEQCSSVNIIDEVDVKG